MLCLIDCRTKAVNIIVAALNRTQRQWVYSSFRTWHAMATELGQSERQSHSDQTLAAAKQVANAQL